MHGLSAVQGRAKLERTAKGKVAGFLWGTLWQRHKWNLMISLVLQAIYSAFNFSGPIILSRIVTFLVNNKLYVDQSGRPLVSGSLDHLTLSSQVVVSCAQICYQKRCCESALEQITILF